MNFRMLVTLLLLCGSVLILPVTAQTSRGTVGGTVTDPNGAVVPGATVSLTSDATGLVRTTTTNDEGIYRFDAVELGTYTVGFVANGFGEVAKTNVVVSANQTSAVDAQLQPGGQQITVDVVAEAGAALQTEAPVRGGNISERQVTELPIAGRNPALLALTLPGVSSNRFGFGIGTFSVNGARGRSNNFLLDGVENNDISVAGQGFQPTNPDAVQEVSVQTSNFDAEFGRAGGAVINTITKSGTNEFHGTLSAFLDSTRDDAVTSSLGRDPRIAGRGRLDPGTQQLYAGTVGGPVFSPRFGEGGKSFYDGRNRTFFFASYQEQRQASTATVPVTVPSAAGRARLQQLFAPGASQNLDTYLAVTQGVVANSGFQNIAIGDRPNCPAPCNIEVGTFLRPFANTFRDRQIIARVDHQIGANDQFTGRYVFGDNVAPRGNFGNFEGFDGAVINRTQNFLLQEVHVFSPTLTNDLRLGYSRIVFDFPVTGPNPLAQTLPLINITTLTPLGVASTLPQGRVANNYIVQDTMSYVRGTHTFRGGVELLTQRSKQLAPFRGRGELTFGTSSPAGGPTFTGFANFIDNFGGSGAAQRDFGSPAYYPEQFRQAYFFQDRWQATNSLTLTLGLRYENFGQPVNSVGTAAFTGLFNVDPVTRLGPYALPNDAENDNNNFAPTVGLAYTPTFSEGLLGRLFGERRTVLRAGYQVTYDSFFNNIASNAAASSPNLVATSVSSVPSAALPRGLSNLTESFPTVARPLSPLDAQTLVIGDLVNPYFQRFSVGVQRELPFNLVVDASYVGTKGTKLYINEDLNPNVPAPLRSPSTPPPGYPACTPGANVTAAQATAQFPAGTPCPLSGRLDNLQGRRLIRTNGGSSIFHSGQLNVSRRFSRGLVFTGAYTWSKFIDNGSEVFGVANTGLPQQAARPPILGFSERLERGLSFFDRTHRGVFTYVYQLPFFTEQRNFVGRALGGWEVSGVTTFESGVPVTVLNGQDADGIGDNLDRPDYNPAGRRGTRAIPAVATAASNVCGASSGTIFYTTAPGATGQCINPADAEYIGLLANSGRTGSLGRNTLRTPGTNLFDVNFTKRTDLTENVRIEFRAEFFNVFNHPNFLQGSISPFTPAGGSLPVNVFTSPDGQFLNPDSVNTDGGGRTIRYQLKLVF